MLKYTIATICGPEVIQMKIYTSNICFMSAVFHKNKIQFNHEFTSQTTYASAAMTEKELLSFSQTQSSVEIENAISKAIFSKLVPPRTH